MPLAPVMIALIVGVIVIMKITYFEDATILNITDLAPFAPIEADFSDVGILLRRINRLLRVNRKISEMNILVLGATGRTGKIFAKLATDHSHQVTAIVREKNRGTLPKVKYIEGSPTDGKFLNDALRGIDAVVVSLNINRTSDNPFAKIVSPLTLISDSVKALIPAMEKNGVKRIVSISGSGVGDSWNDMFIIARLLIRYSNIMRAYEDHDRQEQIIRNSNLDWTIVRPVMLNSKETDKYTATLGKPKGGSISRAGVAKFTLDALETGKYVSDVVTLFS